jgi:S-formylglutathione hydrolase
MNRIGRVSGVLLLAALLFGACSTAAPPAAAPAVSATSVPATAATAVPATSAAPVATSTTAPTPREATATAAALPADLGEMTSDTVEITSQALAGNLLGDPATRTLRVLLPPGYATSGKRYPVVYVLHYFTGHGQTLYYDFMSAFHNAHPSGEVRDMIMVFPDASNKLDGSWYLDSPTTGGYETYIVREVVNYVDSKYRTIPEATSRGVTGCSMGGDGAIHLAFMHPDIFGVAVPVSATYNWASPDWAKAIARDFTGAPKTLGDFASLPFGVQLYISRAAAAAPNPNKPPFYEDMPFEISDGTPRAVAAVWDKIAAVDPTHDAMRYAKHPERLAAIMLYHGSADDLASVEFARSYDKLLTELGIEHEYVEVKDRGHCGLPYEPVLKFMSEHLAFASAED